MKNLFTVDFESLGFANLINDHRIGIGIQHLESPLKKILKLLKSYNHTATFFFVGRLAEYYPELVLEIVRNGHKIGSHSYYHNLIYKQNYNEFEYDLKKSLKILRDISKQNVVSYRAPSWSYKDCIKGWFWDILRDNGIKYDSSIFPIKNYLYGEPRAPRFIHKQKNDLIEIPPSTVRVLNKNFPYSGGFYLRALPIKIIEMQFKILNNNKKPGVLYIHPWELDSNIPKVKNLKIHEKLITYYNINNTYNKLKALCRKYKFRSIEDYLEKDEC